MDAMGINTTLVLWGVERRIEVSPVSGKGEMYHLYIDSFFQGQIFRRAGKFVIEYNRSCDLTGDDLQGLLDALSSGAGDKTGVKK